MKIKHLSTFFAFLIAFGISIGFAPSQSSYIENSNPHKPGPIYIPNDPIWES